MTNSDAIIQVDKNRRKKYDEKDQIHWKRLQQLIDAEEISLEDLLKNYPAFIRRRDLPKFLAHYELFKHVIDLPGSIVELGVYLGAGFFTWAKLLETFLPGDRSRKVYGFDNCSGYTKASSQDGNVSPWIENLIGEKIAPKSYLEELTDIHNDDNLLAGVERCKIIIGDINNTVPKFAKESLGTRISLLYFDVNLFEPTLAGLKYLYPLVVPGGIVAFNAYGNPPWKGEAAALEQFFKEEKITLKKFPFSPYPSAYFIKETL